MSDLALIASMGRVREVFGKGSGIKQYDLLKRIVDRKLSESVWLEYKTVDKPGDDFKKFIEAVLVRPITSFLNRTDRQSGLLILGVVAKDHIPTKIKPVPKEVLDSTKIRQWLSENVRSLPRYRSFPVIHIHSIDCGDDEFVYLIEVESWEPAAYYSGITDSAYARRGDETYRLSIPEFLALSESYSLSDSHVKLSPRTTSKTTPAEGESRQFQLRMENRGYRPAMQVRSMLSFEQLEGAEVSIAEGSIQDFTSLNPGNLKVLQCQSDEDWPLYPRFPLVVGVLNIKVPKGQALKLMVLTQDSHGFTIQQFKIDSEYKIQEITYQRETWTGGHPA